MHARSERRSARCEQINHRFSFDERRPLSTPGRLLHPPFAVLPLWRINCGHNRNDRQECAKTTRWKVDGWAGVLGHAVTQTHGLVSADAGLACVLRTDVANEVMKRL